MNRSDLMPQEYHDYYEYYLNLIPGSTSIEEVLIKGLDESLFFLSNLEKDINYRYDPQKWSIAQVITHNVDTERVFSYRALRFMRGDETPLPGFDQDIFAKDYDNYAFAKADLIQSFISTRKATIELFKGATTSQLLRKGIASDNSMSVRVIPFLIAGHCKHHENMINELYL